MHTVHPHLTPNFVIPTIAKREGARALIPAEALTRPAVKSEMDYQIDERRGSHLSIRCGDIHSHGELLKTDGDETTVARPPGLYPLYKCTVLRINNAGYTPWSASI